MAPIMYGASTRLTTKPGALLTTSGNLSIAVTKAQALSTSDWARLRAANDLHEGQLRHRIEEVDTDEAAWIGQRRGDVLDHDRRRVGSEHGAGLEPGLDALEQSLLDVELFDDGLDHDIGPADAIALGVGNEACFGGVTQRLGPELAGEQACLAARCPCGSAPRTCPAASPPCRMQRTSRRCRRPSRQHR